MEPREARALVHGLWQDVVCYGPYQVRDEHFADVMILVETKGGKFRKVHVNHVEIKQEEGQQNLFEE